MIRHDVQYNTTYISISIIFSLYISLSLSVYIYVYIYIYIYIYKGREAAGREGSGCEDGLGRGARDVHAPARTGTALDHRLRQTRSGGQAAGGRDHGEPDCGARERRGMMLRRLQRDCGVEIPSSSAS